MGFAPGTPPSRFATACALLLVAAFAVQAIPGVARTGYSPDEDLTFAAVEGILRTGAPRLPSGVLYLRGLPYTYLCGAAGALLGHEIPVYRGVSMLCTCLAAGAVFVLGCATGGPAVALLAVAAMTTSPWVMIAAQWARFYGLFLFLFATAAWVYVRFRDRRWCAWCFTPLAALCALTFEPGIALGALPLFDLASGRFARDRAARSRILTGGVLLLAAATGVVFHRALLAFVSPTGGGPAPGSLLAAKVLAPPLVVRDLVSSPSGAIATAVFAASLLAILRACGTGWPWAGLLTAATALMQPGITLAALLFATLLRPGSWARRAGTAGLATAAGVLYWTVHVALATSASPSPHLALGLLLQGAAYPTTFLWYLVRTWPALAAAACTGAAAGGSPAHPRRELLLLPLTACLVLDHANVGLQPRYLLATLPPLTVLAGMAIVRAFPTFRSARLGAALRTLIACAAVVMITREQSASLRQTTIVKPRRDSPSPVGIDWVSAPLEDWRRLARTVPAGDAVVCNDPLGCTMAGLTPSHWYLDDPDEAARFGSRAGDLMVDVYTGARIVAGPAGFDRFVRSGEGRAGFWWVDLSTGKQRSRGCYNPGEIPAKGDAAPAVRHIRGPGICISRVDAAVKSAKEELADEH